MPDLPPLLGEVAKPLGFDGEVQFPVETSQALRASSPTKGSLWQRDFVSQNLTEQHRSLTALPRPLLSGEVARRQA